MTRTVNLPVDHAYAFDYLAILYVKRDNGLDVGSEIKRIEESLSDQLGDLKRVLKSKEFLVLHRSNQSVFDAVASSATSPTQTANRCRYRAKVALQNKFWPTKPLSEKKTKSEQ